LLLSDEQNTIRSHAKQISEHQRPRYASRSQHRLAVLDNMETLGDKVQTTALSGVLTRCTIEIATTLTATSTQIAAAANQITPISKEIKKFNDSTTDLTNQIIKLNSRLFLATIFIAIGTLVLAVAAIVPLFKHPFVP
jgi:hypothetical protein